MLRLLLLLACTLSIGGCFGSAVRGQVSELQEQLAVARAKPPEVVTVVKDVIKNVVVTKETEKVIKDNSAEMRWFVIIGGIVMAISVGFGIFARTILPGMGVLGTAGFTTGAMLFGTGYVTQFANPYTPYFILAGMVCVFIGGSIWMLRHVDWTPDEKEAIDDIRHGRDTDKSRAFLKSLDIKNQGGSVVAPTST